MQHEHKDPRLLSLASQLLCGLLDILLQLLDGVLQRGARIVDLVDDEDIPPDQIRVFNRAEVQPLRTRYRVARLLLGTGFDAVARGELLVEGKPDRLDGDVGAAGGLQERPEDAGRNVTATADTGTLSAGGRGEGGGGGKERGGRRTRS